MKKLEGVKAVVAATAAIAAGSAFGQSSVTLYGIIDTGLGYQSSQTSVGSTSGGRSVVKMLNGVLYGSRFGLRGSEDLGGGNRAIFVLEQGFNSANGAQAVSGLGFSRQAYVGLVNPTFGTLTAGRQYESYYTLLVPWSPATALSGYFGAHPGDIDSLDLIYRANNTLVYTSPVMRGLTFSGSYSLGGVPGSFNAGSTWSAALQYASGPVGLAVGVERVNNSTPGGGAWGADSTMSNAGAEAGVSAINVGYQTAQAQQRVAVTGGYKFTSEWSVTASYSNVQYIPGINSKFIDTAIFNTGGVVLHFAPTPTWEFAAGYSYTRATRANGIADPAAYQQISLAQYYSFSKRTSLYFMEAFQRANGMTLGPNGAGDIINATASIGDGMNGAPSSSRSQFAAGMGIVHKF